MTPIEQQEGQMNTDFISEQVLRASGNRFEFDRVFSPSVDQGTRIHININITSNNSNGIQRSIAIRYISIRRL